MLKKLNRLAWLITKGFLEEKDFVSTKIKEDVDKGRS